MLNLTIWDLVFRTIPEGFVFILGVYAFGEKKIEKRRYIISSLGLGVIIYLVRMLPINFGVHTILTMMLEVLLAALVNKIEVKKSIIAAFASIILMFILEGVNFIIIDKLLKVNIEDIFDNITLKLLYGYPSLIIFAIIMVVLYKVLNRKSI